jgi:hypothetical protein
MNQVRGRCWKELPPSAPRVVAGFGRDGARPSNSTCTAFPTTPATWWPIPAAVLDSGSQQNDAIARLS